MHPGQSFENSDVAEHYRFRPNYPVDVFSKLVEISPNQTSVLDLGCGTGKVARALCESFESVVAIDASVDMLRVAKEVQDTKTRNISWVHGRAESTDIVGGPFDLIVAAESIHWMDQAVVFPRLCNIAQTNHVFAVVDGDGAHEPPWNQAWDEFLSKWIFATKGERYEPGSKDSDFNRHMTRYREWINVEGKMIAEYDVSQTIDQFIRVQFSRDTFTPSRLGSRIGEFSQELRGVLQPHAIDETVTYTVRTGVEWGQIKAHRYGL